MKLLFNIVCLLTLEFACRAQDTIDYNAFILPCAMTWKDECIVPLTTQEIITIADMLLLSYQVVQASIIMSQSRLTMQTELLNIKTLSINDTFDARIQAQNNDLTIIKNAVLAIEKSQEQIKFACNALQNFGPLVIKIDPTVIQTFIANLKNVIVTWAKMQQKTIDAFEQVQAELIATTDAFSDATTIFDTIVATNEIEHHQLLQGTNSLTTLYKTTENMFASFTKVRQESIVNFSTLLKLYFKYHYQVLYDHLKDIDQTELYFIATADTQLPCPDTIFILA